MFHLIKVYVIFFDLFFIFSGIILKLTFYRNWFILEYRIGGVNMKRKKIKRSIVIIIFLIVGLSFFYLIYLDFKEGNYTQTVQKNDYLAVNKNLSSEMQSLLLKLGNGYNVGNSFDSQNALGYNGLPAGDDGLEKFFNFVKKTGFNSVRIPMASYHKVSGDNNTIDSAWVSSRQYSSLYLVDSVCK